MQTPIPLSKQKHQRTLVKAIKQLDGNMRRRRFAVY